MWPGVCDRCNHGVKNKCKQRVGKHEQPVQCNKECVTDKCNKECVTDRYNYGVNNKCKQREGKHEQPV